MTRRAEGLTISWYPEDREALRADAKRAGLSVSAYLRGLWLAARPREVTAGAWEDRGGGVWVRNGAAWAHVSPSGWEASDGAPRGWRGVSLQRDVDPAVNRDAADAWMRSRGVVLA